MDTTETYINMCGTLDVLRVYKYHTGYEEGDFIFVDGHVRVVGHDFINIAKHINCSVYQFAMIEPMSAHMSSIDMDVPDEIVHRTGSYVTEWIKNPVWLPRIDQLISCSFTQFSQCVSRRTELSSLSRAMSKYAECEWIGGISIEQYLLESIMGNMFNTVWYDGHWVRDEHDIGRREVEQ